MIGKRPRLYIIEFIMPHQSKVVKAAVTKTVPDTVDNGIVFNRCGRRHLRVGPPLHWLLARTRIPISRLDGGIDHKKFSQSFGS